MSSSKHWSREDDERIEEMLRDGKSVDEIAKALGRLPVAIARSIEDRKRLGRQLAPKLN